MNWHKVVAETQSVKAAEINLPASKSISNRLLVLQYIAADHFEITNISNANDTVILQKMLAAKSIPSKINCEDAGTVFRFMSCLCAAQNGTFFTLNGTEHLLNRPMGPLLNCLKKLGAEINQLDENKQVEIQGKELVGTVLSIAGDVSSQFISGLCLISPLIKNGLTLNIEAPILSSPYIKMTLSLMEQLNIESSFENNTIRIPQQKIKAQSMHVESDWSSACFFYALMILSDKTDSLLLKGLQKNDIQGDRAIVDICASLGVRTIFQNEGAQLIKIKSLKRANEISLEAYPDLAVPLLVACAFRFPKMRFKNLEHLKLKESNRIEALRLNLEKFGILLIEEKGTISFEKKELKRPDDSIEIKTFSDHRIAMSFSLLVALGYSLDLDNISCIAKSFPNFFEEIGKVGIRLKK